MSQLDEALTVLRLRADAAQELLNQTTNTASGQKGANGEADSSLPWVVRFTWEVLRGLPHPEHTYAKRASETLAVDHAVYMLDHYDSTSSLRLVEAHVKGPGRDWSKVE